MQYLTDPTSPFLTRYPALFPDEIEPDTHQNLLKRARRIFQISDLISETTDIDQYISSRLFEARQTANLLLDSATSSVREQPAFDDSFMPVIRSLSETANMFDSYTDARTDYEQRRIRLKPDEEFYRRIAHTAIQSARPAIAAIFHPTVMNQFAIMSVHRLRNRLNHRDSSNTSLNIFRRST